MLRQKMVSKKVQGFTLIELVVVIIILGILAAVAVPKFVDLEENAQASALQGVIGGLNSANALNYAAAKVERAKATTVANCTDVANIMQGGLPAGYTITAAAIADSAVVMCTLTQDSTSNTGTFQAIGVAAP